MLGLIVVAPLAALVAGAALDRGPDGAIRASIFPTAITVLDPFVGAAVRNSLVMAASVTLASLLVGIGFGRTLGGWRFPFRRLAAAVLIVAAATPPAVLALGLSILVDGSGERAWRGWFDRVGGGADHLATLDWGWIGWFWAATVQGGALVSLAFLSAHARLNPAWRDAAKLAGGSRNRVWWRLNWPLIRPALARPLGFVFASTLADPGAPLILGLRRTLGYQVVASGLGPEPFPRIAALGLVILLLAAVVRLALFAWSGADRLGRIGATGWEGESRPAPTASIRRTLGAWLLATGWLIFLTAPILAITSALGSGEPFSSPRFLEEAARFADPRIIDPLVRSAVLGIAVMVLASFSRRLIRGLEAAAGVASTDRFERFARLGASAPILSGIVVLCLPGLLAMLADALGWRLAPLNRLVEWSRGDGASLPLLAMGVWLATAPVWLASRGRRGGATGATDSQFAAATLAGARRGRARRLALGAVRPARRRSAALLAIFAATNIAPAIVLATSIQDATIGPAVLFLNEWPGDGLAVASALALLIFGANAAAALAWRDGATGIQGR